MVPFPHHLPFPFMIFSKALSSISHLSLFFQNIPGNGLLERKVYFSHDLRRFSLELLGLAALGLDK